MTPRNAVWSSKAGSGDLSSRLRPAGSLEPVDGAAGQLAAIRALMDAAPADPYEPNGNRSRYHCQLLLDPATRSLHVRKGMG